MKIQDLIAYIIRIICNYEEKIGNEVRLAGYEVKEKLYEPKRKQRLVRILTVMAYIVFVSMAAILLSLYYTFIWNPKDVLIKLKTKPECVNAKLSNPLITPPSINGKNRISFTESTNSISSFSKTNSKKRFSYLFASCMLNICMNEYMMIYQFNIANYCKIFLYRLKNAKLIFCFQKCKQKR